MSRTLYRLEGCPYCERVVDRLAELGIEFESVWVEGMHSRRDDVKRVSGQREVPVLVEEDTGVTMAESERILEYLETRAAASKQSAAASGSA
ncbi:MAG: glutaredoxin family protein [Halolamina sp.]